MSQHSFGPVLSYLRSVAGPPAVETQTDRQLLEQFAQQRDEAAFAALVRRHAALVRGVCWRLLRHDQDAEDAVQATFLVLARKADALPWRDSVAGWLHEVAVRVASEARGVIARRRQRERQQDPPEPAAAPPDPAWRELSLVLDQELRRLPAQYRAPLLLCYLEGRTRDEAAELLGWTLGAVKGRLERGRELLRQRLARRGLGLALVLLPSALCGGPASAAWAAGLVHQILGLAGAFRAGHVAGTAPAVALAREVLHVMVLKRLQAVAVAFLVTAALGVGLGTAALPTAPPPGATPAPTPAAPAPAQDKNAQPPKMPALVSIQHGDTVRSVAFAPDGKTLAVASWDRTLGLWETHTGKERLRPKAEDQLSAVAYAPDGKRLVTGGPDGVVRLWDAATGKELRTWQATTAHTYAVAFGPDNRTVAVACQGGEVRLWDADTGKAGKSLTGHQGRVWAVAFSPDGQLLASAGDDRTVRLWELSVGVPRQVLSGHQAPAYVVAFAPDGLTLVSGDYEGQSIWWERATGQPIRKFGPVRGGAVQWLATGPDGRRVAMAHQTGTVRLWDLVTGTELQSWPRHMREAYAVAFSPDGRVLASAARDGSVHLWPVPDEPKVPAVPAPASLTKGDLEVLWKDLAKDKAASAYKAVWALAAHPKESVPLLRDRVKVVPALNAKQRLERQKDIDKLVAELDAPKYAARELARKELVRIGLPAYQALRQAVLKPASVESQRRAEMVLAEVVKHPLEPDALRALRVLAVLELARTPDARAVVVALAAGDEDAPLTQAARAALARWPK